MSRKQDRQNVRVIARVRPLNAKERAMPQSSCLKYVNESTLEVISTDSSPPIQCSFDRIHVPESTQAMIFQEIAELIGDVLNGYNSTILAYGQTGAGKTHTMEGNINDAIDMGIIARSVERLFSAVSQPDSNVEFTFKVSYIQIYMERVCDLLDTTGRKNNLTIFDTPDKVNISVRTLSIYYKHPYIITIEEKKGNVR